MHIAILEVHVQFSLLWRRLIFDEPYTIKILHLIYLKTALSSISYFNRYFTNKETLN